MSNRRNDRKKVRREQAAARQAEYDALSPQEKYARAKARRGESRREISRIVLEDRDE